MNVAAQPDEVRIAVEDPRAPESRWCIAQYFAELQARFETGFDPAATLPLDEDDMTPPAGALLIARLRGRPVGCGALRFYPGWAYLKRMWIAREVRGAGLGRRLLSALEDYARDAGGVGVVRLETNRVLTEAIALYRGAGYREITPFNAEPYAHHWFEKALA
jgi:GNAT superfamily N-acetyltransferase